MKYFLFIYSVLSVVLRRYKTLMRPNIESCTQIGLQFLETHFRHYNDVPTKSYIKKFQMRLQVCKVARKFKQHHLN